MQCGGAVITLAIATRNDYQGLWYTIHSALMSVLHTPLAGRLKISVADNSDDLVISKRIHDFCRKMRLTYTRVEQPSNHRARNDAVRAVKTPYAVLADSHVLFTKGFFNRYTYLLETRPEIGLIHAPFSCGGAPTFRANCFYNMQKFEQNLHGVFSHRGALAKEPYRVALAPHAGYGFRTQQWLDYGGYIDECVGNGGGEPFVTFKYWMFGSSVWLDPTIGYAHLSNVPYRRRRGDWRRNHVMTAFALGGYKVGCRYAKTLSQDTVKDTLWEQVRQRHEEIKSRSKIPFEELKEHWIKIKARPFV